MDNEKGPGWELAKLIGNYERFTQDVDTKLSRIEDRLERGQETFSQINTTMAKKAEQVDNLENRLADVENNGGLSRRRRLQVDGTTIAAIVLSVKEIVTTLIGAVH